MNGYQDKLDKKEELNPEQTEALQRKASNIEKITLLEELMAACTTVEKEVCVRSNMAMAGVFLNFSIGNVTAEEGKKNATETADGCHARSDDAR